MTVHGNLEYVRTVLIPANQKSREKLYKTENVKSIVPLDIFLGIFGLPFKMTVEMMLRCTYWAQNQNSYQDAEDAIKIAYGLNINDDTIRQVANLIGRLVFENDCQYAEEINNKYFLCETNFSYARKGVLYIEVDGAALNTRHKNDEGSTWRENKLGVIFSSDNIRFWNKNGKREHEILKKDYVSYVGNVHEFKKHLYARAIKNGYGTYQETVIISDGASWIANMAEEMFPEAQRILDLFHLKENVYDYAKAKFKMREEKYKPWAEKICSMLEKGEWKKVLEILDPQEKYINVVNLYHYIDKNKDAIDYPQYYKKGYFVGSGAVESANKTVLQERLKQAGMRWDPITAQYLLTLRSKYESNQWENEVIDYICNYYKLNSQSLS